MQKLTIAILATALVVCAGPLQAQSLSGSRASMQRQHQEAVRYGYSFIDNPQTVNQFVSSGYLVKVAATRQVDLHDVSYPYARPAVKLFVDRLSAQYFAACGEKMTVTSLTRPRNRQPANAASNSVHPTGMAVDLRIPPKGRCRSWLEGTLLALEGTGVLDVTRERNPAHYHVAVFTEAYENYVANLSETSQEYIVRRGDSLSRIASNTGTSIAQVRAANGLRGDLLQVGQKLQIPTTEQARVANASSTSTATSAATTVATTTLATTADAAAMMNQVAAITEVTHRVRRGDTLWRIAKLYGTTVDLLRNDNGLPSDFLDVGQVLRVSTTR
jgi:LysM repeat protein